MTTDINLKIISTILYITIKPLNENFKHLSPIFGSSPSARACSPSTRTANSTLGLKKPTLRPWYAIYYYEYFIFTQFY